MRESLENPCFVSLKKHEVWEGSLFVSVVFMSSLGVTVLKCLVWNLHLISFYSVFLANSQFASTQLPL